MKTNETTKILTEDDAPWLLPHHSLHYLLL